MKKIILISIVCLLNTNLFAQTNVIDKVIAVVGKNMIKLSELEATYLEQRRATGIIDDSYAQKCDIFEGLLINKLLLHQANVDSTIASDEEINRILDQRIAQMITAYGSQDNLEKQMNKSIAILKEENKEYIKEYILIQKAQSKIVENVKITPQEVTEFYNSIDKDSLPTVEQEYEFIQIVKIPKISSEEKEIVKDRLNGYRERILNGDKFSTLATLYSEDPASAKKGGELGFFSRGTMVSEFENIAFTLREGEISPVFETTYGFHIIQLIARRGEQINCRHILLQAKVSPSELLKSKALLDSIHNLIKENKISFEDAVKQFSDDASKLTGGTIIMTTPSGETTARFPQEYTNQLMRNVESVDFNKYEQGDIIPPILFQAEQTNAYRLMKMKTKIPAHKVNLTDDYDKIYNTALGNAKTDAIFDWADKRVQRTYIKIDDEFKDCDYKIDWIKK